MPPLLAKSGEVREETTLVGHTRCVLAAVDALFTDVDGGPSRLGRSWLRFFGLDDFTATFARFLKHLRVAAAAHDWGKANDGFQDAVSKSGDQVFRHEHLSGLLLSDPELKGRLRHAGLDDAIVLAAVLSHHVKCSSKTLGEPFPGARSNVAILQDHIDFGALWRLIESEVDGATSNPPAIPKRLFVDDPDDRWIRLRRELDRERASLRDDSGRRQFLAAVRSALIVCDSVGSAIPRMRGDMEEWVRLAFVGQLTGDDIWDKIVLRRIADLRVRGRWDDAAGVSHRGVGGFTEFQRDAASGGPRVLLTAPCGSGKTLAAWSWIASRLDETPKARVLFLYPTRSTATEGFHDYVAWAPEDEAGLLTGTAAYDLQGLFENPDERGERSYGVDPRLFALGDWAKQIVSATADQFFPFLQYVYGPLCHLPMLAESVVVVDEVHSFDRSMFATLKRFLREFPEVPVLCMTATLAPERRADLIECGLTSLPDPPPPDLARIAEHPRYQIEWAERDAADRLARETLDGRGRVLWVSNRVDECRDVFARFADEDGDYGSSPTLCYHSRFKLGDRRERHHAVVRGFQDAAREIDRPKTIFAATTQVCELSLDLDADLLVTELAPIAALIQRMGRCNRDAKIMMTRARIGRVIVLRPDKDRWLKPYQEADLIAAEAFVDELAGREVSQACLETLYEKHDPRQVEPDKLCPFLDSGPYAQAREESFRDCDDYTVPCVLDSDIPRVLAAIAERTPIDPFLVPVPRHLSREPGPGQSALPRWVRVAEQWRYDKLSGFDGRSRPRTDGDHDS